MAKRRCAMENIIRVNGRKVTFMVLVIKHMRTGPSLKDSLLMIIDTDMVNLKRIMEAFMLVGGTKESSMA